MKSVPAAAAALSLSSFLVAQQLPEGYSSHLGRLPTTAGNVLRLSASSHVSFDGQDLVSRSSQGTTVLLHFGAPVFGSFTIAADAQHLLFGESSTNGLWLVPLHGLPPTQPLVTLTLNYDAALYDTARAVVSAKVGGWSAPDNDLWMVNLSTGATQLLAQLPGASGPVAVSPAGDLYYATASPLFPAPPGSTEVLRFRRAVVDLALQQNQVLGIAQADLLWTGLDAASDLAFDNDGDLFFVDWWNNRVGELNDIDSGAPWVTTWIDYGSASYGATALQFVRGPGDVPFEPFQPAAGRMVVHETSYGSISQTRELRGLRPVAEVSPSSPIPVGPVAFDLRGGPGQGLGLVAIAVAGPGSQLRLTLPGFEAALWWESGLANAMATYPVALDAQGNGTLALVNPGTSVPVEFLAQFACIDLADAHLGSSEAVRFRLSW